MFCRLWNIIGSMFLHPNKRQDDQSSEPGFTLDPDSDRGLRGHSPDMQMRLCVQTRCLLMHGTDYKQSLHTHKGKSKKGGTHMKETVPISEKALLTIEEAAEYFNIGVNRIRLMTNDEHCPYVLWSGNRRLIKRKPFEEYLYGQYSI